MVGGLCSFPQFHSNTFLRNERGFFFGFDVPELWRVLPGPFNERSLSQARERISAPVNV